MPPVSPNYFDDQPTPQPPRPDYRRVTQHPKFKDIPEELRELIEAEFRRYEYKLRYLRAGLKELSEDSF